MVSTPPTTGHAEVDAALAALAALAGLEESSPEEQRERLASAHAVLHGVLQEPPARAEPAVPGPPR